VPPIVKSFRNRHHRSCHAPQTITVPPARQYRIVNTSCVPVSTPRASQLILPNGAMRTTSTQPNDWVWKRASILVVGLIYPRQSRLSLMSPYALSLSQP
jgi:hypothetical protein